MESEISDILLHAAKTPYSWAAVMLRYIGEYDWKNWAFGGSCVDKALFLRDSLPHDTKLMVDYENRHMAAIVLSHFVDPTFFQHTVAPIYTSWDGNEIHYPTLLKGTSVQVRYHRGGISATIPRYMKPFQPIQIEGDGASDIQYIIESLKDGIAYRPPSIRFANIDGGETKVSLNKDTWDLQVSERFAGEEVPIISDRLREMENLFEFTADELLKFFIGVWGRVRRVINTE